MASNLLPLAICLTPGAILLAVRLGLRGIDRRRNRHLDDLQARYRRKEAIRRARLDAYRLERLQRAAVDKAQYRS